MFVDANNALETVAKLAYKIWNEHYPSVIGQEQVNYMLNKFYAIDALKKQIDEGQKFYLIIEKEQNIGFFSISEKEINTIFIHKFYVDFSDRNKGIGARVMTQLFTQYPKANFTLNVNRQNFKPINFYFKMGFKIMDIVNIEIGDGYAMNDFIMTKK